MNNFLHFAIGTKGGGFTFVDIEYNIQCYNKNMIRKSLDNLEKSAFSTNTADMVSKDQKLQAMLEYCLLHGSKDNKVPKTKLFKLIYLADFAFYYQYGKSISEHIYKNRDYGPVPDTLFALVDEMTDNGDIKITQSEKAKLHELAVKPIYVNQLSKEEIAILSKVCNEWKNRSSKEIVDFVHSQRPWALTKKDEPVPYTLILQEEKVISR